MSLRCGEGRKKMNQVKSILKVSEQGVSRPYLCTDEEDRVRWCKGSHTGFRSVISEWICACMARRLGLPIPDFAILSLDVAMAVRMSLTSSNISSNRSAETVTAFLSAVTAPPERTALGMITSRRRVGAVQERQPQRTQAAAVPVLNHVKTDTTAATHLPPGAARNAGRRRDIDAPWGFFIAVRHQICKREIRPRSRDLSLDLRWNAGRKRRVNVRGFARDGFTLPEPEEACEPQN